MTATMAWTLVMVSVLLLTPSVGGLLDLGAELLGGNDSTLSRFCYLTSMAHPPFRWCVALILSIFLGHVFTNSATPTLIPKWVSLILFVIVPYLVVVVTAVMEVDVLVHLPKGRTLATYPHATTVTFMGFGYLVGSTLLHQSA